MHTVTNKEKVIRKKQKHILKKYLKIIIFKIKNLPKTFVINRYFKYTSMSIFSTKRKYFV